MSQVFEARLTEWVKWYEYHKDEDMGIRKNMDFLYTALTGCMELLILAATDIKNLEGRNDNATRLVIPVSELRKIAR